MKNAVNWFEIPVKDFERAKKFYEKVLDGSIQEMTNDASVKYGFLPADMQNGVGGALAHGKGYEPSQKGTLVYLNGGDDLSKPLARVETAGGKIILPKTSIGENGFMAIFADTEGNKVGIHSMK